LLYLAGYLVLTALALVFPALFSSILIVGISIVLCVLGLGNRSCWLCNYPSGEKPDLIHRSDQSFSPDVIPPRARGR
jgi:hypothetical protein